VTIAMRTAMAIGFLFVGITSVAAQDYQSPSPPMPPSVDTSQAMPGQQTLLPSAGTPATAQTPPVSAQTPPDSASSQQK
jgi:hypothetical protein